MCLGVTPVCPDTQTKDPPRMTGFRVNVFAPKPERDKLLEEFNSLNEMERQAVSTVHELNEQARAVEYSEVVFHVMGHSSCHANNSLNFVLLFSRVCSFAWFSFFLADHLGSAKRRKGANVEHESV